MNNDLKKVTLWLLGLAYLVGLTQVAPIYFPHMLSWESRVFQWTRCIVDILSVAFAVFFVINFITRRSSRRKVSKNESPDRLEFKRMSNPKNIILLVTFYVFSIVLFSGVVLDVERISSGSVPRGTIQNGGDAIWWGITTATTIGYGDFVPVTVWGRVMATILIFYGVVTFALLVASIAAMAVSQSKED